MKTVKKGIPKSRLPEGLDGIVRSGKIRDVHETFFTAETKNQGIHFFEKEHSKKFNMPEKDEKIYICFYGANREAYFPYKVCNLENTKIFYEE